MVCMGIFMTMLYHAFMYYRLYVNKVDYKLWDSATITLNDYSIDINITDDMYNEYLAFERYYASPDATLNEKMTEFLKKNLQMRVDNMGKREDKFKGKKLEFVMIEFETD